ncbi:hypothetical protein A3464_06805 [Enterobacter genomosp. O]|nr:hypothetical protein A3464_06805 [Enterobacter genomosp. O]
MLSFRGKHVAAVNISLRLISEFFKPVQGWPGVIIKQANMGPIAIKCKRSKPGAKPTSSSGIRGHSLYSDKFVDLSFKPLSGSVGGSIINYYYLMEADFTRNIKTRP